MIVLSEVALLPRHRDSLRTPDRNSKQKSKKGSRNQKLRVFSFLATLGIIVIVIGASYISSLPQVEHVPDQFEFNRQAWMRYVPKEILSVFYVDYDGAYALSGTGQYLGSGPVLYFYRLNFTIFQQDVSYEVDMELPPPQFNGTVTVMRLHDQQFTALQSAIEGENRAPSWSYQGFSVRELFVRRPGDQKLVQCFLSVADGYVILSYDPMTGRRGVQRTLDQFASDAPNLFDNATVRTGVYAVGAATQPCIGLQVGMFQTPLNQSRMIVKSTIQDGTQLLVTRSILFASNDIALGQFGQAHQVYRSAASYKILDSWLVVSYEYPVSRLKVELSGI